MNLSAPPQAAFDLGPLLKQHTVDGSAWHEFFATHSLSMGIYRVPAGSHDRDTHQPHERDEVYLVLEGRGQISIADETLEVTPSKLIFVRAGVDHYFHDVAEDLSLLVLFAGS